MNQKTIKRVALERYAEGWKVEVIAKTISRSKSTVYRYIQEQHDKIRFPIIKDLIKRNLLCGDFNKFVKSLTYKDICLLRRKFKLYGHDKKSKIKAIIDYFKDYSLLGLYPQNINVLKARA